MACAPCIIALSGADGQQEQSITERLGPTVTMAALGLTGGVIGYAVPSGSKILWGSVGAGVGLVIGWFLGGGMDQPLFSFDTDLTPVPGVTAPGVSTVSPMTATSPGPMMPGGGAPPASAQPPSASAAARPSSSMTVSRPMLPTKPKGEPEKILDAIKSTADVVANKISSAVSSATTSKQSTKRPTEQQPLVPPDGSSQTLTFSSAPVRTASPTPDISKLSQLIASRRSTPPEPLVPAGTRKTTQESSSPDPSRGVITFRPGLKVPW